MLAATMGLFLSAFPPQVGTGEQSQMDGGAGTFDPSGSTRGSASSGLGRRRSAQRASQRYAPKRFGTLSLLPEAECLLVSRSL
jgi:hypothetical protein